MRGSAVRLGLAVAAMVVASGCADLPEDETRPTIEIRSPPAGQEQVGETIDGGKYAVPLTWNAPGLDSFDVHVRDVHGASVDSCLGITATTCEVTVPPGQVFHWSVIGRKQEGTTDESSSTFTSKRPIVFIHGWQFLDTREDCGDIFATLTTSLERSGFYVVDADRSKSGTQSLCYDTGDTGEDQHIPWIAAFNAQPELVRVLNQAGVPDHARFDIVAHSMGGLVSRVLAEQPGRSAEWDESGWRTESTGDIDPKWSEMVHTLVMIGTPNNGANNGIKEKFASWFFTEVDDMRPRSTFLDQLGYSKPDDKHYVSIGSVHKEEDPDINWRDYDGDGRKNGHDGAVPGESPFLDNPDHFYLFSGLAHSTISFNDLSQVQYGARAVMDVVEQELLGRGPGPDTDALRLQSIGPMNTPARIHSAEPHGTTVEVNTGETMTFAASCTNEDSDHHFGEWGWIDQSGNHRSERDHAQLQSHPWKKSKSFTFDTTGTTTVSFRCVDLSGTEDTLTWDLTVVEPPDDPPYATALYPPQEFSSTQGEATRFDGRCDNSEGDLDRAEWWADKGQGWYLDDTDSVQMNTHPWEKSRWFSMEDQGTLKIKFLCIDQGGQSSEVVWVGDILEAERRATRVSPSPYIEVTTEDSQTFEAQCENPVQNVDRGEWWTQQGDGPAQMENSDSAQWQADPWEKSRTYTFQNTGEYRIYFKCYYEDGHQDEVFWEIEVS